MKLTYHFNSIKKLFLKANRFFSNPFTTPAEKKAYRTLVDQTFYKSLLSIWTSLAVGFLVYAGLLYYPHDWKIHLWIILFCVIYFSRFLMYYLYFKSDFLSFAVKKTRYSSAQIIFWGGLSGLIWVFLLFIIKDYPIESQLFSIFPLVFFSIGVQSRYSLLPLWYVSYLTIIIIPFCAWLFLEGGGFILLALGTLLFAFYTITVVYSYFHIQFDFVFLRIQHVKLLTNLKIVNEKLNLTNQELLSEIQRRQEVEKKLEKAATHDGLTKLPNRLLLEDRLNQAIINCKRNKGIFSVFFIDLDGFKAINDSLGHEMGDMVLKTVATRLKKTLREEDTVSRIGGDEFVILVPHLTRKEDIDPIAEKVIKVLARPYVVGTHSLTCTASMGISLFPSEGMTYRDLIKHADAAMYKAKREGGSRFAFYTKSGN